MILKSIKELKGCHFIIPSYQRGYRWESEQVMMLVNDLLEAHANLNDSKEKDKFYCLQPVVVVPLEDDKNPDRKIYEVVDGQQRLTTLWLLFNFLKGYGGEDFYTLEFKSRPVQQDFIDNKKYLLGTDEYKKNIDNFYLYQAYQTIKKLLQDNNNRQFRISQLCQLDEDWKKGNPYTAVIWHEITEKNALQAFKDLNYGKIPLTAKEIIKALLLQKDCYGEDVIASKKADQRAAGWENLSIELNAHDVKGMLGNDDMDILEELINNLADELNDREGYQFKRKSENKYTVDLFDYYVVNEYIKRGLQNGKERSTVVNEIWEMIQDKANRILNWFDNRTFYHLIGLYSLNGGGTGKSLISTIIKIEKDSGGSKSKFIKNLKDKIASTIRVPVVKDEAGNPLPLDSQGLNSPNLRYQKEDSLIRKILTAFNVWQAETQQKDGRRFPFRLFRMYNPTSLEHIHPKSVEDGEQKEYISWLKINGSKIDREIASELEKLINDNDNFSANKERINKLINSSIDSLDKINFEKWIDKSKAEIGDERYNQLKTLLNDEESFEEAKEMISKLAEEKGESIFELKKLERNVHKISNLALLDKITNSELQFNSLDVKRKMLEEKDSKGTTFIPPATLDVFSKKYSAGNPGDMRYWLENDRQNYLEKLQEAYSFFTESKKINHENIQ